MSISLKDRVASGVGSILEWFDFALYGFFAPIFAQVFFTSDSQLSGILKAFSIFAVGFVARPIGALVFGVMGDKYGRAACLRITPLLIALPTMGIALLPSYAQIGMYAPVLLITCRIIQGLCIGGEFSNNIIYLCESVSSKRRYFIGSLGAGTATVGILLASISSTILYWVLSQEFLLGYGWRLVFGLVSVMGFLIYWFRQGLNESNIYKELSNSNKNIGFFNSFLDSIKNQKTDYLKAIGLTYLPATAFYFIFFFMPSFASTVLGVQEAKALGDNSLSLTTRLLLLPLVGILADHTSGLLMTRIACFLLIVLSLPFVYVAVHRQELFFYCIYGLALISIFSTAVTPGLLVNILKPATRCTVFSISFNVCYGIFGGIVPMLGFFLVEKFKDPLIPVYYLIFSAIITLISSFTIRREVQYA